MKAIVLFAHGARDPRWAAPFERLQKLTQDALPEVAVRLSFLEFMSPALPALVAELAQQGCQQISVVPVFLGQGGHVLRDLPLMLDSLRADYPAIQFRHSGAVGEDAGVLMAIRDYCVTQI
ncbi:sirohydrochlorin chelatase [Undibacterium rugosum]|uniref:sirohydrochlorin chelatase n=1 Tax=Undibacterium rugosum TaxID=2762291 RepID=UPI001B81ACF2|nr:CbiX/SirB N-terminal domain-containing protein [Undibacterium rugosum]MBR7777108.1 CbiX/SirB N-terminal domain-containing protein [Undibacterium rugosum]